jgi:uncharacterized protein (TIGR02246 family)
MKRITGWMLALAMVAGSTLVAQQQDADIDRLVQQYVSAWNKGDANALAAMFVDNAMRTAQEDQIAVGKQAIQGFYAKNFAGDGKGTKLTVKQGRTQSVGADVRLQEGTWELTGGTQGPQRGRYLNTMVRQGGEWKLAAIATIPDPPPAK